MNTFMNRSTWVVGFSFQVLKNLSKFEGVVIGIKPCGMMMGNPLGNIMGFIIGLRGGGGFTIGGGKLIIDGGLIIGKGGGFG